ncbi:MAG: hypothetical protein DHS20C18_33790 [Saprospiraceae bacterium]|nr:MAG: hypothetical protein DHS20C18_33790 [Saprospiraceae bacterium]
MIITLRSRILLLLLWNVFPLFSQIPALTHIYQISSVDAEIFYRDDKAQPTEAHFGTLIDSFSTPEYAKKLASGHYLFVKAEKENLDIQLRSFHSCVALALNNDRDLAIQVIDSTGLQIANAEVLFRNKKIAFDSQTQTYRLRKWNKGGFLKIKYAEEAFFYEVKPNSNEKIFHKKWKRFKRTKVGHVLSAPFRWGKNTYHFFKRGFGWGDWSIYNPPFRRKIRPFKGYLALNKPKFRHGDTLKVKAYVTHAKGRPWKDPLELKIIDTRNKTILERTLKPETPGAFMMDWVIGDTLQLDAYYHILIKHPEKERFGKLIHSFRIEDYELNEITYSLSANQDIYRQDEKIVLSAEGKDANGLNIADGRLKLVLIPNKILNYHQPEVLIPDTLWQETQSLKAGGPTQILVPDSIFPAASMEVKVQASFINANGELHKKSVLFNYSRQEETLIARIDSGLLIVDYFINGQPSQGKGQLSRTNASNPYITQTDSINLPYRENIRPEIEFYHIRTHQSVTSFTPKIAYKSGGLNVSGNRHADSLFIQLNNPQQIPVTWTLRTAHRQLATGQVSDVVFNIAEKDQITGPVYFQYQYLWGGQSYKYEKAIYRYEKMLDIEIDLAAQITPGETVQVKLSVKDHKNRPAKGVNLVAGAVNTQFSNTRSFKAPSINYKLGKKPLVYNSFQLQPFQSTQRYLKIDRQWFQRLGLDKDLFYQLRFSDQGIYTQYDTLTQDTFFKEVAQFSPYLIKNGQAQPIYLIYCNRQLVYYYNTDHPAPYSFVGNPGYNRITIRSRNLEYTMDSVLLKTGQKLEIAIDENQYTQSPIGHHISRRSVSKELNSAEQTSVKNSIFVLRKQGGGQQYLWSSDRNINAWNNHKGKSFYKIGPFPAGTQLSYQIQGGYDTRFEFEPGYSYELQPNRERLYQYTFFHNNQAPLPYSLELKMPGELINTPSIIKKELPKRLILPFQSGYGSVRQGLGRYAFQYQPKNPKDYLLTTLLVPKDNFKIYRYYRPFSRQMGYLPPGEYELYCFKADSSFFHKEIVIRPDTLLYQDLQNMTFERDSLVYNDLILNASRIKTEDNNNPPNIGLINPYDGNGQLISGQVTDRDGEPLIGATILLLGTTVGTVTDYAGNYELWVPNGHYELAVSYMGYNTHQLAGQYSGQQNVTLEEGQALEEVVVTGLRISSTRRLSSTVSGISADPMNIRGSRANSTSFYIDGVRVQGNLSGVDLLSEKLEASVPDFEMMGLGELANSLLNGIRTTFRDDAYWVPNLITDQNGEAFYTVTFPEDITSWQTFVLGQDKRLRAGTAFAETRAFKPLMARLSLPRFLIEGDEVNIIGKSLNFSPDSVNISTSFSLGDQLLQTNQAVIKDALIEKAAVAAPAESDSLQVTYALSMDQYQDGEQRSIPIFPQGTMETTGNFYALEGDTSFTISSSPQQGPITIFAQDNILEVLLEDLDELRKYPYGCMEQTASQLMALLLEKQVKNQLGEPFDYEKEIVQHIVRLKKFQNPDGSWGWWSEGTGINWITIHVIKTLQMAEESGYSTVALEQGLRFLTSQLNVLQEKALLPVLNRLSTAGQNLDYAVYLQKLDTFEFELYDQLQLIQIRQQQNLPYTLDSLDRYRKTTLFGSYYWGFDQYHLHHNRELTTLLAYQIYKHEKQETFCHQIRQFFLEQRAQSPILGRRWGWRNTYATSSILSSILPDLLDGQEGRKALKNTLSISGLATENIQKFPYQAQWSAGQDIQVHKTGTGPLFLTAYQQFHNTKPAPKADEFILQTNLFQEGRIVKKLEQGKRATLKVELEVKAFTEYLMLEVPIPAGCSYAEKTTYHRYPETHRAYFRQHTALFFKEIQPGKYTFTIELEPRFSGLFTLNPARAEQMYFPVFYGRNELKKVEILD